MEIRNNLQEDIINYQLHYLSQKGVQVTRLLKSDFFGFVFLVSEFVANEAEFSFRNHSLYINSVDIKDYLVKVRKIRNPLISSLITRGVLEKSESKILFIKKEQFILKNKGCSELLDDQICLINSVYNMDSDGLTEELSFLSDFYKYNFHQSVNSEDSSGFSYFD